jgi:hypothetical protein
MLVRRITRFAAAIGLAVGLFASAPLASADTTLSTQGPNSGITTNTSSQTTVTNNNSVYVTNSNYQSASSGNATVSNNTTGGNATSGNASNSNSTCTSIQINNGGTAAANNACNNSQGGGQGGGGGTTTSGGGQGSAGQVLGASMTIASLAGGQGGVGGAQLPNTGLRDGLNPWVAVTILTLMASTIYWRVVISPRLSSLT